MNSTNSQASDDQNRSHAESHHQSAAMEKTVLKQYNKYKKIRDTLLTHGRELTGAMSKYETTLMNETNSNTNDQSVRTRLEEARKRSQSRREYMGHCLALFERTSSFAGQSLQDYLKSKEFPASSPAYDTGDEEMITSSPAYIALLSFQMSPGQVPLGLLALDEGKPLLTIASMKSDDEDSKADEQSWGVHQRNTQRLLESLGKIIPKLNQSLMLYSGISEEEFKTYSDKFAESFGLPGTIDAAARWNEVEK